jgi:hypothetical protein
MVMSNPAIKVTLIYIKLCQYNDTVLCGRRLITFWGNIAPSSSGSM